MTTALHEVSRPRAASSADSGLVTGLAADLLASGLPTAPHVIADLLRRSNDDPLTVREVVAVLSAAQRSGQRMLPTPLPLVASMSAVFEALDLGAADLEVVLVAALSIDDALEVLIGATGRSADELLTGALARSLAVSHGRFRLTDARIGVAARHEASPAQIASAHALLERAHRARAESALADWHRARAALQRIPDVARVLTTSALRLNGMGRAAVAHEIAAEAAAHAEGADRERARLVAGTAAIGAGCCADAADWLRHLCACADVEVRAQAVGSALIAEAGAHGVVPAIDPAEHRPHVPDERHWETWARTAGLAAVLCAERGMTPTMRSWLAELREADGRAGVAGTVRDPAVALCWMLTGESDGIEPGATGPFSGAMVGALAAAVSGDIDAGLQLLAAAQGGLVDETDPLIAGFERSPLIGAYLAVTEALLRFWRGDLDAARDRLAAASVALPVGVPFAGLGAALAQRLDIAVLGAPGPISRSLMATLPDGARIDALVDSGLGAYLDGAIEQAATDITLWHDRGGPRPPLGIPGLDEVGPIVEDHGIEPPETTATRTLLHRIRRLPETSWRREHDDIAEAGRALHSAYDRGRVEALLGSTCVSRGDVAAGRRHLRAARRLFEEAGATAWTDATEERLARLRADRPAVRDPMTEPIAVIRDTDPLEASRIAWETLLTAREIEVAMRVAAGGENREIAQDLDVSVRTVEVHVGRLFDKLGVRNRVELAVLAHRTGRVF